MILNLIQNAQDVLIQREINQPCIIVFVSKNAISIQDNAGGIDESIINSIYELHFTTKNKTSVLYMSKKIL
ncbi:MAG: ATP-binding protein [Sulfurimonas sp.]|nr:ATP-binding protein [Sulfurimonas sp.]